MPILLSRGESCLYTAGFSLQARSSDVPGKSKVIAARLATVVPKNKKTPIATNPGGLPLPSILSPQFIL